MGSKGRKGKFTKDKFYTVGKQVFGCSSNERRLGHFDNWSMKLFNCKISALYYRQ